MVQIVVIGNGAAISKEVTQIAEELGKEIARVGATLVCGGRAGVMEAACRGAHAEGGLTVGILPDGMNDAEANDYLDIRIGTHMGYARNSIVANSGNAVIAIGGALGTLSEIAFALNNARTVILLEGTGGVVDHFKELEKVSTVDEKIKTFKGNVLRAKTPKEAVELAIEAAISS